MGRSGLCAIESHLVKQILEFSLMDVALRQKRNLHDPEGAHQRLALQLYRGRASIDFIGRRSGRWDSRLLLACRGRIGTVSVRAWSALEEPKFNNGPNGDYTDGCMDYKQQG
jgi:hypothetical protein